MKLARSVFQYSPELDAMVKLATFPPHKMNKPDCAPIVVTRLIDGHEVCVTGSIIERSGVSGVGRTLCLRWKIDGRSVNKAKVLVRFGLICSAGRAS